MRWGERCSRALPDRDGPHNVPIPMHHNVRDAGRATGFFGITDLSIGLDAVDLQAYPPGDSGPDRPGSLGNAGMSLAIDRMTAIVG